eukprot:1984870-Rhodomonas_salina.2
MAKAHTEASSVPESVRRTIGRMLVPDPGLVPSLTPHSNTWYKLRGLAAEPAGTAIRVGQCRTRPHSTQTPHGTVFVRTAPCQAYRIKRFSLLSTPGSSIAEISTRGLVAGA